MRPRPELYKDYLGPYFNEWAARLYALCDLHNKDSRISLLFATRAGFALKLFYDSYIESNKLDITYTAEVFPISRLSTLKAAMGRDPIWASYVACGVLGSITLKRFIERLLGTLDNQLLMDYMGDFPTSLLERQLSPAVTALWFDLEKAGPFDGHAKRYFNQQLSALDRELSRFRSERYIFVDSGLHGITLELLSGTFPTRDFWGALIYKSNHARLNPETASNQIYGLMGSSQQANYLYPHTFALRNWHLIEELLEPKDIESFQGYPSTYSDYLYRPDDRVCRIADHIREGKSRLGLDSLRRLNRMSALPTLEEVRVFMLGRRTNDLTGSAYSVIMDNDLQRSLRTRDQRLGKRFTISGRSLWIEGQRVYNNRVSGFVYNLLNIIKEVIRYIHFGK